MLLKNGIFWLVIAVVLILIILLFFFVRSQSKGFVTEEFDFYSDKILGDLNFVFFSDLHEIQHGIRNRELLIAIRKANPDIVLIGGDILTSKKSLGKDFDAVLDFIRALSKEYKVVFALGNHERALFDIRDAEINEKPRPKDPMDKLRISRLESCLKECDIDILRNEGLRISNRNVNIYGLDLPLLYYRRFKRYVPEDGLFDELLGPRDENAYNILLAHDPEHFKEYALWHPDLVLSGHLHGGIIRVPLLGGLISPQIKLFPKYDAGVFNQGDSQMLLTRGIGYHSIPVRIFNKAQLCNVKVHCITDF